MTPPKLKDPIVVSSLSFDKARWTRGRAARWLRDHDYGEFKVQAFEGTKNYWRMRVLDVAPNSCNYRREHWGASGILATYCVPKRRAGKVVSLGRVAQGLRRMVA